MLELQNFTNSSLNRKCGKMLKKSFKYIVQSHKNLVNKNVIVIKLWKTCRNIF